MLDLSSFPQVSSYKEKSERKIHLWGTAIGAWGDTLCCMGEFHHYPHEGGMCYYGFDPQIPRFLLCQPNIHAVDHVIPRNREEYIDFVKGTASDEHHPLPFSKKTVATHLRPSVAQAWSVNRWHGARLDREANFQAERILAEYGIDEFILLQPFSTQSCDLSRHWPYWNEFIRLVLCYSPYKFLLVGQGWEVKGEHPKVLNLVNEIDSMMTVFALAERAVGCISTPNSLAIYGSIQNIPTLALGNEALETGNLFRQWIDYEPVRLIHYKEDVAVAFSAFAEMFRL